MARLQYVWAAALVCAIVSAAPLRVAAQPLPGELIDPTAEFFDDAVLHDVHLWINSKDWETLKTNYLSNTYYPADFQWQTTTVHNVGIRSRGTGSRSGFKPGLRVDMDRYSSTQKFLGVKSFILRNNTQDASQMHEWLSMRFFRRMGLPAPREAYARLFVNNVFSGLYTIVESVDKSFLARNFGENEGYLYDYDYAAEDPPYYFEDRGPEPDHYVPKPFKPDTHELDARPDVIVEMVRTINTTSGVLFRTAMVQFIDLAQFIRQVAGEVFLADQDGFIGNWGMNNFFLYRPALSNQFRMIAWDKSNTFVDGPTYSIWHNITDVPEPNRNRLMSRALEYGDLRELYLETLLEAGRSVGEVPIDALPGDLRGWLEREIDRAYGLIAPSVQADALKPYSNEDFQADVDALRVFARERAALVSVEVSAARGTQ
jgi:spore coat protein CotH